MIDSLTTSNRCWCVAALILLAACSSKGGPAVVDAGRDTGAVVDTAQDFGAETGTPDVPRDTGAESMSMPDVGVDRGGGSDGPAACTSGQLGAACASAGGCCPGLRCLSVGGDQAHCCVPVGGACTQESDCCGNGLSCVNGQCCGVSLLSCSATNCCPGYYCNPGNYCSRAPDAGTGG